MPIEEDIDSINSSERTEMEISGLWHNG
jgi:hypothetical protein